MIRKRYWSTGITLRWHGAGCGWSGNLTFHDYAGHAIGELRTRDAVTGHCDEVAVALVVDTLRREARHLGIRMGTWDRKPNLYGHRDGEAADEPMPAGWELLLRSEAARINWTGPDLLGSASS
jgi:hypothetical protein